MMQERKGMQEMTRKATNSDIRLALLRQVLAVCPFFLSPSLKSTQDNTLSQLKIQHTLKMYYLAFVGYCFSAFLVWRAWIIVYRLWFHPLSHVPGPFLGRISNFYRIIWFIIRDEHLLQIQLHEKYGWSLF
jgi:hypothetical protein